MYLWIPLPENLPSAVFAERLMEDEGAIVLPGSGFGAGGEGFFRISFITSPERIAEAAQRAGRVLRKLTAASERPARTPAGVA
jgi:LL-diaminopimelate aminotransferase